MTNEPLGQAFRYTINEVLLTKITAEVGER
jgi:hypothetical protein